MPSTENWWTGRIDWATPAGQLLQQFLAALPDGRTFHLTVYGSAALQLALDRELLSADVDIFSDDDLDLAELIAAAGLDKTHGRLYLEAGYELSFRTGPRWRGRAVTVQRGNASVTIPHPLDVLIAKLHRLDAKDMKAFERVIQITGHPVAAELLEELQAAVDLFRPGFAEESPSAIAENTQRLWREIYHLEIDVQREIIEPAIRLRNQGYGGPPPNYKRALGD